MRPPWQGHRQRRWAQAAGGPVPAGMTRGGSPLAPAPLGLGNRPGPGAGREGGWAGRRPCGQPTRAGGRRDEAGCNRHTRSERKTKADGPLAYKTGGNRVSETRSLHLGPAQMLLLARSKAGSFGRPYMPWPSVTLRRMCRARKRMTVHPHHPSLIHEAGKARKEKYPESH